MLKPDDVFDRSFEWRALTDFVDAPRRGASLGLVYGRRRQGKTYLLQGLCEAAGGLYFPALRQSAEQSLARLASCYAEFVSSRAPVAFPTWSAALEALIGLGQDAERPVTVVLDEFPHLVAAAPELPSALQALLSPRGQAATRSRTRLVLCGSAFSTMRGLLGGTAPLRGRAAMELIVHPFGYRDASSYWGVAHDRDLAVRLHALVGGTPAYLDMSGGAGPASREELDTWVVRALLNPASAMFREGNVLLAEEETITDSSTYLGVLSAISSGRHRRSEIAAAVGRPQTALAHPLAVLTETKLVTAQPDAVRQKRTTFHVADPVMRLHHLVVAPNEARLTRHRGAEVWAAVADTVSSKVFGPHFEALARTWCADWASPDTLGGDPGAVGPSEVSCPKHRCTHEVDVVVTAVEPGRQDRLLALGEAKWRTRQTGVDELQRLEHLRDLFKSPQVMLLLFSRNGFTAELRRCAAGRDDVRLVDLDRLYTGD